MIPSDTQSGTGSSRRRQGERRPATARRQAMRMLHSCLPALQPYTDVAAAGGSSVRTVPALPREENGRAHDDCFSSGRLHSGCRLHTHVCGGTGERGKPVKVRRCPATVVRPHLRLPARQRTLPSAGQRRRGRRARLPAPRKRRTPSRERGKAHSCTVSLAPSGRKQPNDPALPLSRQSRQGVFISCAAWRSAGRRSFPWLCCC